MKIAVICSNGKVGKLVVAEAQVAGLEVTGFAKSENKSGTKSFVQKDLFALIKDDLAGFDVVVDAFGAWAEADLPNHSKSLNHLCDLLSGSKTRLIIVGGAGSLYVDKNHTAQVMDGTGFPDAFKPLASAMGKALTELRARDDVQWTYISPAGDFQADGAKTGKWLWGGEELTLNAKGESIISYADYAAALVEEITRGNHIKQRISLVRA
ncbi:NAD(P)-dependent oxidoreductase [Treponema saccharophilum]|uniref:Putative NADH-flavin reductase n=1 Tax=Treponema saccharophilum DSM 2985 TaxID=907348 RepID=H7EKU5_9SPIR|nr:NAD(P)H-binding protein [Treponema saccharophilum]EIC01670.1 putative NADH-flavin reductase [Treponema saccharophilum DSM 2985]BDC97050.1 dihydrodipicolinate reductase [Treponema saccharophilum]